MKKAYMVAYINDWGNPVLLYKGTLVECQEYYEKHIGKCESLGAFIDKNWM